VGKCGLDSSGSRQGPVVGPRDTVRNLRLPKEVRNFLTKWLLASQGLSSTELVK
jgi:hypothetical protein